MGWDYRVVKVLGGPSGDETVLILCEVYYGPSGKLEGHYHATPSGDTLADVAADLDRMRTAMDKPILLEEEVGTWAPKRIRKNPHRTGRP